MAYALEIYLMCEYELPTSKTDISLTDRLIHRETDRNGWSVIIRLTSKAKWLPTLRPRQSTWAVRLLLSRLHPP